MASEPTVTSYIVSSEDGQSRYNVALAPTTSVVVMEDDWVVVDVGTLVDVDTSFVLVLRTLETVLVRIEEDEEEIADEDEDEDRDAAVKRARETCETPTPLPTAAPIITTRIIPNNIQKVRGASPQIRFLGGACAAVERILSE